MSSIFYIASDKPLPKCENPHEKLLSVREALALGITDLPDFLFSEDFDRDKPEVVLYADREIFPQADGTIDDGGFPDDYAIDPMEKISPCRPQGLTAPRSGGVSQRNGRKGSYNI